jgi:predicted Zn-dependent protease
VERLEQQARWGDAILIIKHAQSLLNNGDAPRVLSTAAQQRYNDLDLLLKVEQIRLRQAATDLDANRFKTENAFAEYAQAFAAAGIVLAETEPEEIALRLNHCSPTVRTSLIAALYNWRSSPTAHRESGRAWIKQVLQHVDHDPWRKQVSEALDAGDGAALNALVDEHEVASQPAALLSIVANTLIANGSAGKAQRLLLRARREHPDDFWINYMLGGACEAVGDLDNAVVYYSAAVSVRQSPLAYCALGSVQRRSGDVRAAVATYQYLS